MIPTITEGCNVVIKKEKLEEYFSSMKERINEMSWKKELEQIEQNQIRGTVKTVYKNIQRAEIIFADHEYTLPIKTLIRIELNLWKLFSSFVDAAVQVAEVAQKNQISSLKNLIAIKKAWTGKDT